MQFVCRRRRADEEQERKYDELQASRRSTFKRRQDGRLIDRSGNGNNTEYNTENPRHTAQQMQTMRSRLAYAQGAGDSDVNAKELAIARALLLHAK